MKRIIATAIVALLSCAVGRLAVAHPTPSSLMFLDFTVDGARLEQDVPIEELQRALGQPLVAADEALDAGAIVQRHEELLRAYALAHVNALSADTGAPWIVELTSVVGHLAADGPRARFRFVLRAPSGSAAAPLRLHDDLITHQVMSHTTTVFVRSDWADGITEGQPRLAGVIRAGRADLTLNRRGSFWRGFRSVVAMGMDHIATGTDHLLFLFALVLVAPLTERGRRWQPGRGTGQTLRAVARLVSAFTIGHSLTLALGALLGWRLPAKLVEVGIAASILLTAAHALRPLFPRREALVAGAFGLIHGMAFAGALAGRDLGRAQTAWTLLAFNAGIELAQLGLLALALPWLLLLARTRAYRPFRVAGGTAAAVLATAWLLERALGLANPTTTGVDWLQHHPLVALATLAAIALGARAVAPSSRDRLQVADSLR